MSCQEVRSMLSAYIDGELQSEVAESVEQHLAQCAKCAHEHAQLARVTGLLRANAEVEPPALLLQQIEAATVARPGVLGRIRARLGQTPMYVRWATVGAAAAVLILALMYSLPKEQQSVPSQAVRPSGETPRVVITPRPTAPASSVGRMHRPVVRSPQTGRRPVLTATRNAPVEERERSVSVKPRSSDEVPATPAGVTEAEPGETAATGAEETAPVADVVASSPGADLADTPDVPAESRDAGEVKVAKADADTRPADVQEDSDALQQLKARLASARRARNYDVDVPKVEGKKHSVKLVGLRF